MDKIIVNGLRIFAYHGVNPEEKENGQTFVLDIVCHMDLTKPCRSDDLNDTVSYAKIIKKTTAVFTEKKYDLLEKAAQTVADTILESFPMIEKTEITLKKPEAPIRADFDCVAVYIERKRK